MIFATRSPKWPGHNLCFFFWIHFNLSQVFFRKLPLAGCAPPWFSIVGILVFNKFETITAFWAVLLCASIRPGIIRPVFKAIFWCMMILHAGKLRSFYTVLYRWLKYRKYNVNQDQSQSETNIILDFNLLMQRFYLCQVMVIKQEHFKCIVFGNINALDTFC